MAASSPSPTPQVVYPAPAGCAPHERSDWLPALPVAFLRELRERHVELANAWAAKVDRIAMVRDDVSGHDVDYRRALAAAVGVADDARDQLNAHVLVALEQLRLRRAELDPYVDQLSQPLLVALSQGSGNQRAVIRERRRRELAAYEAVPAFVTFTHGDPPSSIPEMPHAA